MRNWTETHEQIHIFNSKYHRWIVLLIIYMLVFGILLFICALVFAAVKDIFNINNFKWITSFENGLQNWITILLAIILALGLSGFVYYAFFTKLVKKESWDTEHQQFHTNFNQPHNHKSASDVLQNAGFIAGTTNKQTVTKSLENKSQSPVIYLNHNIGLLKKHLNRHTLLMGGTGWGKTSLLINIWNQKRLDNEPIIFVDGKGDEELIADLKALDPNLFVWSTDTNNPI